MVINFIGSFTIGYVGEQSDETHLANELEALGNQVQRVPRDIWKAYVDGEVNPNWTDHLPVKSDINLIAKWHHFNDGKYIRRLREVSGSSVFYWVWDYMYDNDFPDWHLAMCMASDLYLTNEYGIRDLYKSHGITNLYYFPFDVADGNFPTIPSDMWKKEYDVAFFGSWIGQGDRQKWLTEINKKVPVTVFSWNYQDWPPEFINRFPAVYGNDFVRAVSQSKICLQFSVNDHCWGYWSNRVGKVLTVGGFLLARYIPGMELFLRDGAEYFSSVDEAVEKINYYLIHEGERQKIANRGYEIGRDRFTSKARIKELVILIERYLKGAFNG